MKTYKTLKHINLRLEVVTYYYYHNSSCIFHPHQNTGGVINAYPNTHNEEKKEREKV